jgi:Mg-chelatase subunit ChlD
MSAREQVKVGGSGQEGGLVTPPGKAVGLAQAVDQLAALTSGMCHDAYIGVELSQSRWAWDPVRSVILVSQRDLLRLSPQACAGIIGHEVGHYFVTRAHLYHIDFPTPRGLHLLLNGIEDPRVNTWIERRYPGTGPWLRQAHDSYLDEPSPDSGAAQAMEAAQALEASRAQAQAPEGERAGEPAQGEQGGPSAQVIPLPAFLQFCFECASEEARGWRAAPPAMASRLDGRTKAALEQTRAARMAYATCLPPSDLGSHLDFFQLFERYWLEALPQLLPQAARVIPMPQEQVARLSALEALDIAREEIFPVAARLFWEDAGLIARYLQGQDPHLEVAERLPEMDLPRLVKIAGEAQRRGMGEGEVSAEGMRVAQEVIERIIYGVHSASATQRGRVFGPGRPGMISPDSHRGRGGSRRPMHRAAPRDLLGQLRHNRRDDYEQLYEQVSHQVNHLADHLQRVLVPRKRLGARSGYPSGQRVDMRKVVQFEADPRRYNQLWVRKTIPERQNTAVLLLVDLSGSMRGERIEAALAGTILMVETLARIQVPFSVMGFQDVLIPFVRFEQRMTSALRKELLRMREEVDGDRAGGNNNPSYNDDGPCVAEAAELLQAFPATDRFLIVVSDGLPEGERSNADDLHDAIRHLSRRDVPVEVIGVGLGEETGHVEAFYPVSIARVPVPEFARRLGSLVESLILRRG